MTVQQSILKFFYPALIYIDNLISSKDALQVNSNYSKPSIPVYGIELLDNDNKQFSLGQYKGKRF